MSMLFFTESSEQMAYTLLSRCKTPESMQLLVPLRKKDVRVNPGLLFLDRYYFECSTSEVLHKVKEQFCETPDLHMVSVDASMAELPSVQVFAATPAFRRQAEQASIGSLTVVTISDQSKVTRTFVCMDIYLSQLLGVCSD
jgi:hypothetical protein